MLEVSQVSYVYKNHRKPIRALTDAVLTFKAGQVYAIIGKSGSGKSTLLSLLGGLDDPSAGKILLHGQDLKKMDKAQYRREHVSFIYQNYNLFPVMTAVENVALPLRILGQSRTDAELRAQYSLRKVGLESAYDRRLPRQLSGGEQQRVAIARAIVGDSGIILADEPTGNLDTANGSEVFRILQQLSRERQALIIIATHDLDLALQADSVIRLQDGRVLSKISAIQSHV